MKPTLPTTNASRGRAPALTLVTRGLQYRLLAINLFHKTTAFTTSVEGSPDPAPSEQEPSLPEGGDHSEVEPTQEDEGLYISSFLKEALGGDGNLQIKMAHTLQAQEKSDKKCFLCQLGDHLMKDHYRGKNGAGPLQLKGPPQNKSAQEMAKASLPC